jgi:hypothetical protein
MCRHTVPPGFSLVYFYRGARINTIGFVPGSRSTANPSISPLAHPFHVMTPALAAHGARVGGSDRSSTLSLGLPQIAPASCHRRGRFLLSLPLIVEKKPSPGAPPLFSAAEKREHGRSRGTASFVCGACGGCAGDTDQSNTVWAGVP